MSIDTFLLSSNTTDLNYPEVRPTLDLNFARVKALDPRITFTRASGGSYVGADGLIKYAGVNEPRFDHDPVTGESLGLLVEEARTNVQLYSEQFGAWANGTTLTVTANAGTSPSGTTTAYKIIPRVVSGNHYLTYYTTRGSGTFSFSVYAKASGYPRLGLRVYDGTAYQIRVTFDLSAGTVVLLESGTASITPVGNGWYRCSGTGTSASGNMGNIAGWVIESLPSTATVQGGFTGDGTSGALLWGAQVEVGAFPTSYIPTSGSTATRAADVANMTGTNFSSWYNQSQGTIFTSVRTVTPASVANGFLQLTDGTTSNRIEIQQSGSGDAFPRVQGLYRYLNSTTASFLNEETGWIPNGATVDNWAFGFNSLGFTFQTKFDTTPSTGSGTFPQNLTNFSIGHNGTIARLAYYPVRLPDAQLQVLTR